MEPIREKVEKRFQEGPGAPMWPPLYYHVYSLPTDSGKERVAYVPLDANRARQYVAKIALRTRVTVENFFDELAHDDQSSPR